jgi:hypothetical protein
MQLSTLKNRQGEVTLDAEALALVRLSRVAFRDGDYARLRSLAADARAFETVALGWSWG